MNRFLFPSPDASGDPPSRPRRSWRSARLAGALAALPLLVAAVVPQAASAAQSIDVSVTQATGTADFDATAGPGQDVGAGDDVVRSNDTVTYQVQFNVNDTQAGSSVGKNVTIRQTLPAGMTWSRLPATCRTSGVTPVSSISADGASIVCNVGDVATGISRTLLLGATVTEQRNGTTLTPLPVSVSADGAPGASETPAPVTVSSVPRVDMVKQNPAVTEGEYGGVQGFFLKYPLRMRIPAVGGRAQIGYEPPAAAMSLVEDFSGVSPNATFVRIDGQTNGTWTAGTVDGQRVTLAIDVTDPNRRSPADLTGADVTIFVPRTDVAAHDPLVTRNVIVDRKAQAPSGTPAVGEDLTNNAVTRNLTLVPVVPGPGAVTVTKSYVDVTSANSAIPNGEHVVRGELFQGRVSVSSRDRSPTDSDVVACDVFDTVTQQVSLAGPASDPARGNGKPAWVTTNTPVGVLSPVIEYSTQPTSSDADPTARWQALRATTCSDADDPTWSTTVPSPDRITKVRVRAANPPASYDLAFVVNLTAKSGATTGTTLANFAPYALGGTWTQPTYDPTADNGTRGDRLFLSTANLRLTKAILVPDVGTATPDIAAGDDVRFSLTPFANRPSQMVGSGPVEATDVTVTDLLPAGTTLSTVPGHEASPAPRTQTRNADGTTTLTWHFDTVTSGQPPTITYWASVSPVASGTKVNRAIVGSPDDAGSLSAVPTGNSTNPRYAAKSINVDGLGGIQIDKAVRRPIIEPVDEMTFDVTYANLDLTDRDDMDTIDVLPFNGDGDAVGTVPGRNPGSAFHGTISLDSVEVADPAVERIRYIDADPRKVYATYDPSITHQAGFGDVVDGHRWCTETEINAHTATCPASIGDATAVRVTRDATLASGASRTFSYTLKTSGNRSGDVYANTAALRSTGLALGTLSPTRTVRVVANRIGDYVWNDLDENGRQDADEPGVGGVKVTLTGVDRHGRPISVTTTTDEHGKYVFTSSSQAGQDAGILDLVSGTYRVTFDPATLPERASFTGQDARGTTDANDSDADRTSGRTDEIVLPDPRPSGVDGQDLTLDAGIVIAPAPPTPDPDPDPPTPTAPEPPAAEQPPTTTPQTPTTPDVPRPEVTGTPRLALAKVAGSRRVRAGGRVTYRLTVRNVGTAEAREVRVCDVLPDRLTLVTRSAKGSLSRGRVCWTIARLKPGQSATRRVVVRVDADAPAGSIVNRATATLGTGADATTTRAKRSVRVSPARRRLSPSRVTG